MCRGGDSEAATAISKFSTDTRGGAELIGVVLLIGFVLVGATSVVVVGSTALSAVQEQSEVEQTQNEFESISESIDTSLHSRDPNSMGTLEGEFELSEGATITVHEDGNEVSELSDINTGQLRYDGVVYEGGLVVDDGRVIDTPQSQFEDDYSMIQLPTFIDYEDIGRFNGDIRPQNVEAPTLDPEESLTIKIESEYAEQWATHFNDANAKVNDNGNSVTVKYEFEDSSPRDITHALSLGMSDGSPFNLNDIPNTHVESYDNNEYKEHNPREQATVAIDSNGGNVGGELKILGELLSSGDGVNENSDNVEITNGVDEVDEISEPTPTDELLIGTDDVRDILGSKTYTAGDDLTGGIYYIDGSESLSNDIEVTDQSILIVDGDLTIEDNEILAYEALDVHVHGELTLTDSTIKTDAPHHGTQVSVFVSDDVDINGDVSMTGLLYGTDSTVEIGYSDFDIYGGVVIDSLAGESNPGGGSHGQFNLYYDETLKGELPYATTSVVGSPLTTFFDSHDGPVHEVDVDLGTNPPSELSDDEDLLVTGSVDGQGGDIYGDLLVKNGADIQYTNFKDDLIVADDLEIEGGVVDGDIWVDGDIEIPGKLNLHGDLYVNGDATIEGGTYDGDIYVTGDLDIDWNPNINGGEGLHVADNLDFDGEPIDMIPYVGGDATVDGQINNDFHVVGDVDCPTGNIDGQLHVGSSQNGCGGADSTNPTPPDIPGTLSHAPEITELTAYDNENHYFDIRVAEVKLE